MPLFEIKGKAIVPVERTNFSLERDLQKMVEENLDAMFNCRFVASEFSTGARHAGRIDTLALSEENNPVIIEYKKRGWSVSSSSCLLAGDETSRSRESHRLR